MKAHTPKSDVGFYSFLWVSLFILDFVSSWFRVYSIYLAGERTEKVSNEFENAILYLYRKSLLGNFLITFLAEIWVTSFLLQYSKSGSELRQYYRH